MDSAVPPHYVTLPAHEVYQSDLPDALFRTLAHIRGLAYRFRGKRTPPLMVADLAALRGRSQAAIYAHLAELRERGIIRTEPVAGDRRTFVIYLVRRTRSEKRRQAAQAEGEVTPAGARDDGSAGIAATHHAATFPLRWGSGATPPAYERGDAIQATHKRDLPRPGLNGHGANGARLVPSPGRPPPNGNGTRRGRPGENGTPNGKNQTPDFKSETPDFKNGIPDFKNAIPRFKNGIPDFKNEILDFKKETRSCHVVVVKDHDSKKEEEQLQQHERAPVKNESDFDGTLQDLAGVLAEYGMRPGDAQRRARRLLEECGVDVCARQRQVFERRCELARASRRGLSNPVGLLCASIQGDWSLPAAKAERKTARWYTDEEFEAFFEH
jgi:hypothetical protein